jgi:hypothetical protein
VSKNETTAAAEKPTGDLTDEQLAELFEEATTYPPTDEDFPGIRLFARLIERAAIAAHLARQPKAEYSSELADDDRYQHVRDILLEAVWTADDGAKQRINTALDLLSDIATAPRHLARQAQAEPVAWITFESIDGKQKLELGTVASNPEYTKVYKGWKWLPLYLAAPVAPAGAQNASTPDRAKLLRAALDAADKWASTEHLHARGIGKGGRGDEKAVVRAENAARKAITALAGVGVHAALEEVQTAAARDVLAERRRQVEQEGWTPEHDDEHNIGEMAVAACCYAFAGSEMVPDEVHFERTPMDWPWASEWWKPSSKRRNLIKAGALILAEIERIDRAALQTGSANTQEGGV